MESILFVDNDIHFAQDVMKYFEKNGIPHVYETDGLNALNIVRDKKPSVVIADRELPNLDGLSLCKFIKLDETLSHIKFLLLTSSGTEDLIVGSSDGLDAAIEKPIGPKDLVDQLIKVLQTVEA